MFGMFGRFIIGARAFRAAIIVVLVARIAVAGDASADTAEAKKIFTTRCTACHTFGKGVKVGPDLKGVTERRQRPWLLKFIRSSSTVIASGDATAVELFGQFNQMRMPDWVDLTEDQVNSILDWLAGNGPDQQDIDARLAESATLAEIESGRKLFHGERAFSNGGMACVSCHSIRDGGGTVGGSLAADLTDTFATYQDGAVSQFLKHPCFRRLPESTSTSFLSREEQFYIKGYLRQVVVADRADGAAPSAVGVAKPVDPAGPGGNATPGSAATKASAPAETKRVAWTPKSGNVSTPVHPLGARLAGTVLFLAFPYIAVLVLIIGLGVRYAMARRRPDGASSEARAAWQLFSGRGAWRTGLLVTVILHLLGLVIPRAILAWNGVPMRLYVLEASGFLLGAVALVGWIQIMRRYLGHPQGRSTGTRRAGASEIADGILLSLLGLAVLSGLVSAVLYRWGSSWAVGTLTPYMRSLALGVPTTELVEQLPFLVRLHTLSWFAMIAVLPFGSFALVPVTIAHRGLLVIARPFEASARAARRAAGRLSPARWLWPEEDAIERLGDADEAQEPS